MSTVPKVDPRQRAEEIKARIAAQHAKRKGAGAAPDEPAEETAKRELSELEEAFKRRAEAEQERFMLATDPEYWVALCFQSRDQKEEFLRALDLMKHGDKYLDGWTVAKQLGVKLTRADVPYNTGKGDVKLDKLT